MRIVEVSDYSIVIMKDSDDSIFSRIEKNMVIIERRIDSCELLLC